MSRSSLNMNLWEPAEWSNISRGQKGQTTAFWVHGIKSDGEKRNCGTFCLTWPEENYWLLCGSCMVVSGVSCSAVIKIQLLLTAGTQMPFWIVCKVRQLFLQPRSCFRICFSNCFLLHLIPILLYWMKTQEAQNLVAIFCLWRERSPCQGLWVLYGFTLCQEGMEDKIESMHMFKSFISTLQHNFFFFFSEQLPEKTFCSRRRTSAVFFIFLAGLPMKTLPCWL